MTGGQQEGTLSWVVPVEESVRDGPTQTQASSEWSGARDALRLDRLGQEIRTVGLFAAVPIQLESGEQGQLACLRSGGHSGNKPKRSGDRGRSTSCRGMKWKTSEQG
jgi:hypothetical protein